MFTVPAKLADTDESDSTTVIQPDAGLGIPVRGAIPLGGQRWGVIRVSRGSAPGGPVRVLPKLQTTPEALAKALLKQRPLKDVEQEQKRELG